MGERETIRAISWAIGFGFIGENDEGRKEFDSGTFGTFIRVNQGMRVTV
jgi:hypothetical protein